jgi:hypothetical protein
MQRAAFMTWFALRISRWLCWIALLVYSVVIIIDRPRYLNSFGHPLPGVEAWLFGLFSAPAVIGLVELMMREKAGLERPGYFKLWPPK